MRLSYHSDYALRILLYLASPPRRATVGAIAEFYQISAHHLGKVVHRLGRLGYVTNTRGPGGGVQLARPLASITVGEVVRQFESDTHLLECVGSTGVCVIQPGCRLRGVLVKAERLVMDYLDGVTLESLLPADGDLTTFVDTDAGQLLG